MDDGYLEAVKQRAQAEAILEAALQAALHQPHHTHRINTSLCAVLTDDNDTKVLGIATPDGHRIEVPLTNQAATSLANALLNQPATNGHHPQ